MAAVASAPLSGLRAASLAFSVSEASLSEISRRLRVDNYILIGKGEEYSGGRSKKALLADAMEAIIGALYLDRGYDAAKVFIEKHVLNHLPEVLEQGLYTDPKSRFQEMAQEKEGVTPSYRVLREWGPDHDRHFVAGAYLGDELVAEGEGVSKQEAQRAAAKAGLEKKGW